MEFLAALIQAGVLIVKYWLDESRRAERKEMERNDAIENAGEHLRKNKLRLLGRLIDLELRRQDRNSPGGSSPLPDPLKREGSTTEVPRGES